jgi:hypothetical protein
VAWFKKKPSEPERLAGLADEVCETAIARFAALGVPVTVLDGTSGMDVILVSDSGSYPLHNVIARALAGNLDAVNDLVVTHVDRLVEARATPDADALTDADWFDRVRVRLMPIAATVELPADYARRIAEDFVVMLCLDYPTHVSFLSDGTLGGRDPQALASVGLSSVMDEPVESVEELRPGIWLLQGESPYTATKVLGMQRLIGTALPDAPHGVLFGIPNRHVIIAHPVAEEDSVQAIATLASLVVASATDSAPGGALSTSLYFWHEGEIDVVGRFNDGGLEIDGSVGFREHFGDLPD